MTRPEQVRAALAERGHAVTDDLPYGLLTQIARELGIERKDLYHARNSAANTERPALPSARTMDECCSAWGCGNRAEFHGTFSRYCAACAPAGMKR